jgi:hypothetical protein
MLPNPPAVEALFGEVAEEAGSVEAPVRAILRASELSVGGGRRGEEMREEKRRLMRNQPAHPQHTRHIHTHMHIPTKSDSVHVVFLLISTLTPKMLPLEYVGLFGGTWRGLERRERVRGRVNQGEEVTESSSWQQPSLTKRHTRSANCRHGSEYSHQQRHHPSDRSRSASRTS